MDTDMQIELMTIRKESRAQKAEIDRLKTDLRDCRNELCLYCGQYKMRHCGACDACRWRDVER